MVLGGKVCRMILAGNSEDAQNVVGRGEGERGRRLPTDFRWVPVGLLTGIHGRLSSGRIRI